MRDFFLNLLQNLDKLTGMKQYEKLMQMDNYKKEINTLLDILCRVSDLFPFIPDYDKTRIINAAVITDSEFIGLNAKVIYKWLNAQKDRYFQELAHRENEPNEPPLEGEALQKKLAEWQEALAKMEINYTQRVDIYQTVREQWKPKEGTEIYQPTIDSKILYEKDRHFAYIKSNYDARTGNKLDNWIPEEEFNIQYDNGLL